MWASLSFFFLFAFFFFITLIYFLSFFRLEFSVLKSNSSLTPLHSHRSWAVLEQLYHRGIAGFVERQTNGKIKRWRREFRKSINVFFYLFLKLENIRKWYSNRLTKRTLIKSSNEELDCSLARVTLLIHLQDFFLIW